MKKVTVILGAVLLAGCPSEARDRVLVARAAEDFGCAQQDVEVAPLEGEAVRGERLRAQGLVHLLAAEEPVQGELHVRAGGAAAWSHARSGVDTTGAMKPRHHEHVGITWRSPAGCFLRSEAMHGFLADADANPDGVRAPGVAIFTGKGGLRRASRTLRVTFRPRRS